MGSYFYGSELNRLGRPLNNGRGFSKIALTIFPSFRSSNIIELTVFKIRFLYSVPIVCSWFSTVALSITGSHKTRKK